MLKKIAFLHQNIGPRVAQKIELLFGSMDPKRFVEVSPEDADYLFFTPFTPDHHAAGPDTIKILIAGENLCPDFNACDYAIGSEHLNFGDRYLRVPIYAMDGSAEALTSRPKIGTDALNKKTKFCNFIYSNQNMADPVREQFFHALNSVAPVVSAGRFLQNDNSLQEIDSNGVWADEKRALIQDFRFTIAIENAEQPGYVTEKISDPLLAHSVPIYWGDPCITDEFNAGAFVNLRDYASFEEAILEIQRLDSDPLRLLEMLNAPVFLNENDPVASYLATSYDFIENIFAQPLEAARRRPRHGWVEGLERQRRRDQMGWKKRLKRNRF